MKKIFKYKWKILTLIFLCLLCYIRISCFTSVQYRFDDGKYLFITYVKDDKGKIWETRFEHLVDLNENEISFTNTRYGEDFLKGTLSKNRLSAGFKEFYEEGLYSDRYSSPSCFDKVIELLTFKSVKCTPYTKWTVSGRLIRDNEISGTFNLGDKYGDNYDGKFRIIPSTRIPQKEIYPYLAVGKSVGPMIKLIDPRTVHIYSPSKGRFIIDEKEYSDYESFGKRIQKSASNYGTDIPVALHFYKDMSFRDIQKDIDFVKSNDLYRFEFRYFRDEKWDGITMFKFDAYPHGESPNLNKNPFIEIKCLPGNIYTVLKSGNLDFQPPTEKLNLTQLQSYIARVCKTDLARREVFDFKIEDDVSMQELVEVFELIQLLRSKGFSSRFMGELISF